MLVKYWMSTPAITVTPETGVSEAMHLLRRRGIHMMPVIDAGGALVGVVSERDLAKASPSVVKPLDTYELMELLSSLNVGAVMSRNPVSVFADVTIEETADRLLTLRISGAPVVDPGKGLVGVITRSDIFRALISLTGAGRGGIQFALTMVDRPGCIKQVTDIVRAYGGRLLSTLTSYERVSPGHRRVYLRVFGLDSPGLERIRSLIARHATILYIVDGRDGSREIFC